MKKTTTTQITPQLLQPSPELLELQHLMPIKSDDLERLNKDIGHNGVRDAIKVYQNNDGEFFIIGGLNRWEIAIAQGIDVVDVMVFDGTSAEYSELVIDDNFNRRHLDTKGKQGIIEYRLKQDPKQSNRAVAVKVNASHKTVGKVRKKLEMIGEIEKHGDKRGGAREFKGVTAKEGNKKLNEALKKPIIKLCPHCGGEI